MYKEEKKETESNMNNQVGRTRIGLCGIID